MSNRIHLCAFSAKLILEYRCKCESERPYCNDWDNKGEKPWCYLVSPNKYSKNCPDAVLEIKKLRNGKWETYIRYKTTNEAFCSGNTIHLEFFFLHLFKDLLKKLHIREDWNFTKAFFTIIKILPRSILPVASIHLHKIALTYIIYVLFHSLFSFSRKILSRLF